MESEYGLIKELKDAGFPQEPSISTGGNDGEIFGDFYIVGKKDADAAYRYLEMKEYEEYANRGKDFFIIKIPTLSELIEACGEEFYSLQAPRLETDGPDWIAFRNPRNLRPGAAKGKTPQEAVANLYLALKK